jgi:hypothetical protein
MIADYTPQDSDEIIRLEIRTMEELITQLDALRRVPWPDSLIPALTLDDGRFGLTICQVEDGAMLVWFPRPDFSFHTVGDGPADKDLAYSFGGQYTETSADTVISIDVACEAAMEFIRSSVPYAPGLGWVQD